MSKFKTEIMVVFGVMFFLLILPLPAESEKISTLETILKPRSLHVYGERAFITEKDRIHIVSLNNGELLNSFGKQGEGPGEFKGTPTLRIFPDTLTINSWGKISFFDHDGQYIKEMKHQFGHHVGAIPLGDKFIGQKSNFSEKEKIILQSYGIYDASFHLLKKLFESPNPHELDILPGDGKQPFPVVNDNISLDTDDERIYISDSRQGFFFKIFDSSGKWVEDIRVNLPPRRVDNHFKKNMLARLEAERWWKQFKNKLDPVFPRFFPEIHFFLVRDKKIFVQTYVEKENRSLFRIYDLPTQKLSEVFLPTAYDKTNTWYDIRNGRYYYLKNNESTDTWELFVMTI
jgi:hypothetical protein